MWTPVESEAEPNQPRSLWRIFLYTLLSLILAAGLLAQIGYRHLDRINQHETIRPWLLTLCEVAGCALPTRQDSTLIASSRLSIEPHPDYQNASRVVLSFRNTASFSQPLPAIELAYSDIQGREVAGRRFYPKHYHIEPTTFTMPAGDSVTAQLDFANPAAGAVNYQVRFVYE